MTPREPAVRRASHVEMPVAYAAVGATKSPDVVRFPPEGATAYEQALQLGSGEERFILASSALMTWGAQRGAGLAVDDVSRGSGSAYAGPVFDDDGVPQAAGEREEHFAPDGEPFVVAGTTAVLRERGRADRGVLVIYTIEEERRFGFAWGTTDEEGAVGEQLFVVEQREDGTVWALARGFLSAPRSGLLGIKARSELRAAEESVERQLAALLPGALPVAWSVDAAEPDADAAEPDAAAAEPDTDVVEDGGIEPDAAAEPEVGVSAEPAPAEEPAPETMVIDAIDDAIDDAPAEGAPAGADPERPAPARGHRRRPAKPQR